MNTLSAKSYAFKFGIYNLNPPTVADFFILVLTYSSDQFSNKALKVDCKSVCSRCNKSKSTYDV